ncbi:retrotransposon protein, putative, ty1-copia subclass [Tanacetum coccineum]
MGYSFYYPPENKVLVARNAEFLENSLITQEASGSLEDLEIIQEEDTHPSIDTSLNHEEDDLKIDEPQSDIIPIRRSTRTRRPTDRMCLYIDAEENELKDLAIHERYEVWDLVDLPLNGKTIASSGFRKNADTRWERYIRAIKILIAIAAFYDYEIGQMDVKTAFLNGYLSEEVYVEQPEGLKSYYNDVKYGYVQKELTNDEVEFLKLFEEEIEVRLNYRDQMRRWEMYVNGRPLGPRRERPE